MGSLVAHTIAWVTLNILLVILISSGLSDSVEQQDDFGHGLNSTDTDITLGNVGDIGDYKANFGGTGMPVTLKWFFGFIDGIWLAFIIIGWIRGVN